MKLKSIDELLDFNEFATDISENVSAFHSQDL